MEIQHGGKRHQYDRNIFRICMSNFLKIGETDCELLYCIELQYGGRPPSWISNYADFEVTPGQK
jgi:hypothetical protein